MSDFKVGDRVVVAHDGLRNYGNCGKVTVPRHGLSGEYVAVLLDGEGEETIYLPAELKLIESFDAARDEARERFNDVSLAASIDQLETDPVALPPHYRHLPVECIDITEHFNFCMGNALKYIWRADHKGNPIQDLKKAAWYIEREVARREKESA
ncbi:DUF3310 domain-containing protein [Nocardioides massiliensis]|uniref:DUF3310 domain-containing protein n=1 Tax=Nocardioides massiliensis TaxID=1325935 RepID=A0ABT9NJI9_9ACTN|nr:DUF3310 domain-containing protein [Nocardioides massiliensis]MDP9820516.1 hypothetical protein [Nocardioides massiliensis]